MKFTDGRTDERIDGQPMTADQKSFAFSSRELTTAIVLLSPLKIKGRGPPFNQI